MTQYQKIQQDLVNKPKTWLITGVAGFIGSNLLETLLKLNQTVARLMVMTLVHQKWKTK